MMNSGGSATTTLGAGIPTFRLTFNSHQAAEANMNNVMLAIIKTFPCFMIPFLQSFGLSYE
jgi:hypothetical protein